MSAAFPSFAAISFPEEQALKLSSCGQTAGAA
jgi:hypothetical protein